jgi:F0F1-type ATP synthase assembly protein I
MSQGRPPTRWYSHLAIGKAKVAAVILAGFLGWVIDRGLGTQPWVMIALLLLGLAVSLWYVDREIRRIGQNK